MIDVDFSKGDGLVPAIIQDETSRRVLMLGYMNREAFDLTQSSGKVTFFSRSRNSLWTKGETSGNFLLVKDVKVDCDKDTLLITAAPVGPTCHTGADTCFGEVNGIDVLFLSKLTAIIKNRRVETSTQSYTSILFNSGIDRMAQKVGEEAVEVVIEAKNDDIESFKNEASDLLFHLMVLLEAKGLSIDDLGAHLAARNAQKSKVSAA